MTKEMTPNGLLEKVASGTIKPKEKKDSDIYSSIASNIPIAGMYSGIEGTGDYDCRRSSHGSFSYSFDTKVVGKVPIGDYKNNAIEFGKSVMPSIKYFKDIAPETMIIIAKVDNEIPKPVVVQRLIKGKPICETSLKNIFSLDTLTSVLKIVKSMDNWFDIHKTYDLCGQKPAKTRLGILATYIPFLSDNIMVDTWGHAWLIDNILVTEEMNIPSKIKIAKFIKRKILHLIPELVVKSVIVAKKVDIFVSKFFRVTNLKSTEYL